MRGIGLVGLALVFSVGCSDKARPKFDECEALENQRRLEDAVDACKAAVAASATSRAGKAAAERLAYLAPKLDAAKNAVQAAKATAAKDPRGQPSGKEREACDHLALLFPESKVGQEAAALLETWKKARERAEDPKQQATAEAGAKTEKVQPSECERRCARENELCDDCLFVFRKSGITSDECPDACYAGRRCTCP